ncbi:MAG TPA: (2Fe-2S)-binding protein [Bryobacteraceae bacterium]|nr:(2Fe-2S)-binding protein [Bryobacteraceae bacterium]
MSRISRRKFVEGTGAGIVASAVPLKAQQSDTLSPGSAAGKRIQVTVNGALKKLEVEDRWTLVELLRDHLDLTGAKIGCDRGECGACTVLLDGKPVYSCSQLAVWADGRSVETVEGLARDGRLDPLQEAFIEHDGPQCGFCTSGQLMSARALLNRNGNPTADEVRAAMAGNICRCSNYNRYVESVLAAAKSSAAAAGAGRSGRKA